jgi:hypothetical protein
MTGGSTEGYNTNKTGQGRSKTLKGVLKKLMVPPGRPPGLMQDTVKKHRKGICLLPRKNPAIHKMLETLRTRTQSKPQDAWATHTGVLDSKCVASDNDEFTPGKQRASTKEGGFL